MKSRKQKQIKTNNGPFEEPPWFRRLLNGTLLGLQKDKLILQILQRGGGATFGSALWHTLFPWFKTDSPLG
jgi:hypothetical protein